VVALDFIRAWENDRGQPYYPFEGLAGCAFTEDGTLVVCDEGRMNTDAVVVEPAP